MFEAPYLKDKKKSIVTLVTKRCIEKEFTEVFDTTWKKKTWFKVDLTMNWTAKRLCTEYACFSTYGLAPKVGRWWLWVDSSPAKEVEKYIAGPVAPAGNDIRL